MAVRLISPRLEELKQPVSPGYRLNSNGKTLCNVLGRWLKVKPVDGFAQLDHERKGLANEDKQRVVVACALACSDLNLD